MNRRPLVVKAWQVGFDFYKEVLKSLPLQVRFEHRPVSFWSESSLSKIASVMGIPKVANDCTTRNKSLQYARVLVEVDVTVPRVHEVKIDVGGTQLLKQKVWYKNWSKFCLKCDVLGHVCQRKTKWVHKWVLKKEMTYQFLVLQLLWLSNQ